MTKIDKKDWQLLHATYLDYRTAVGTHGEPAEDRAERKRWGRFEKLLVKTGSPHCTQYGAENQ